MHLTLNGHLSLCASLIYLSHGAHSVFHPPTPILLFALLQWFAGPQAISTPENVCLNITINNPGMHQIKNRSERWARVCACAYTHEECPLTKLPPWVQGVVQQRSNLGYGKAVKLLLKVSLCKQMLVQANALNWGQLINWFISSVQNVP